MIHAPILPTDDPGALINADAALVVKYIEQVWNRKRLSELSVYLHDGYVDHSIPYPSLQNRQGLKLYLDRLAQMVSHTTRIIGLATLGELVICHIIVRIEDISDADVPVPNSEVFYGYRTFRMLNGKIAEHWEIL